MMAAPDRQPGRLDAEAVGRAATGRWPGILASLGVPGEALRNRHGPCPGCGGSDRFRFDDREGRGTFYCSQGGGTPAAGDGFELLKHAHGWSFPETLRAVAGQLGMADGEPAPARRAPPPAPSKPAPEKRQTLDPDWKARWHKAKPITPDDPAGRYLIGRGCALPPADGDLRWHPKVKHWLSGHVGPALVALVTDPHDPARAVTLHLTWIAPDGGGKANLEPPRLTLPKHTNEGVVRLWPDEEVTNGLLIAEGIESALTAARGGIAPVWACLTAGNMAKFPPLAGIEALTIVADHDKAGQDAANACAAAWHAAGHEVRVWTAAEPGNDFNDLWNGGRAAVEAQYAF